MTLTKGLTIPLVFAVLTLFLVSACTDSAHPTIIDGMTQDNVVTQSSNRSMYFKLKKSDEVSFSVVYTGDLDEILFNSSSHLRALIETYDLQLTDPFEIDYTMKGIVLRSYEKLNNPLEIAKEVSQCEEVLMVEVKNLPENQVNS